MRVTIIGSGNVATVMGKELHAKGHTIVEVYSRQPTRARELAAMLGATAATDLTQLNADADLYLVAVSDDALPAVAAALLLPGKLVAHTAGSVTKQVFANTTTRYGVVWPIKMVRKNMLSLDPVTMVVDGSDPATTEELRGFAAIFSDHIVTANDEVRLKMHMLASFTLNFTNHLFHLAADYCEKEGIDFSMFHPLILESVQRLATGHPRALQAGPAFRGDSQTIAKHLALLANHPQAAAVYKMLTESITSVFHPQQP